MSKIPEKKKRSYKKRKSQENVNKGNVDDIAKKVKQKRTSKIGSKTKKRPVFNENSSVSATSDEDSYLKKRETINRKVDGKQPRNIVEARELLKDVLDFPNPDENTMGAHKLLSEVDTYSNQNDNTTHLDSMKETAHLTTILTGLNTSTSTPTSKRKEKSKRNRNTPTKPLSSTKDKLKQVTLTQMEKTSSDNVNIDMHLVEDSLLNKVNNEIIHHSPEVVNKIIPHSSNITCPKKSL